MTVECTREAHGARRACVWLAAAAVALTFAVVVASAYLRHWQAGLSCEPWPACYARVDVAAADSQPSASLRAVRLVHRLSAAGVTAAILGLLLLTWTQRPVWLREALTATAALAMAAALAVLGIVTPGSKLPAVVLGNLLGGYSLLALVAATCPPAIDASGSTRSVRLLAIMGVVCAFAVAALGGSIGAHYASRACPMLMDCGAAGRGGVALDVLRAPAMVEGRFVAPEWAAALHSAHRIAALTLVAISALVVYGLRREQPRLAIALSSAVAIAVVLGVMSVSTQPSLATVVLHNASAASVVALLAVASVNAR